MAENTDEELLNNQTNTQSENPSDDITPTKDTDTITQNQETENMEVHKHPHHVTRKKKWGEYLLEFFMLFLAVTLGFIAENLREEIKHKVEVKTQINSLVSDLQTDISLFESGIDRNKFGAQMADSLIELLHSDITNTDRKSVV